MMGIQVYSNEVQVLFKGGGGDNHKSVKIGKGHLNIFFS
jgi:hypothetical protein